MVKIKKIDDKSGSTFVNFTEVDSTKQKCPNGETLTHFLLAHLLGFKLIGITGKAIKRRTKMVEREMKYQIYQRFIEALQEEQKQFAGKYSTRITRDLKKPKKS